MQSFDIIKKSNVKETFRVNSILSMFDMSINNSNERFQGTIDLSGDWNIGVIVGPSGSGKSTISNELFSTETFFKHQYSNGSILDEFPQELKTADIIKILTSVGFSSPPSWLKPYDVLSNGEKMRVDLALALSSKDRIVFDEFTSVVDRVVAQTGSYAINKYVRKLNKQFVAVTCHYDVLDWLEPDWIFDTKDMRFYNDLKKKDLPSMLQYVKSTQVYGEFLKNITI